MRSCVGALGQGMWLLVWSVTAPGYCPPFQHWMGKVTASVSLCVQSSAAPGTEAMAGSRHQSPLRGTHSLQC